MSHPDIQEAKDYAVFIKALIGAIVEVGFAGSRSEAKRLIKQGAVEMQVPVMEENGRLGMIFRIGKLRWLKLLC